MKARPILALVCALGTIAVSATPAFAVEPVVVVDTDKDELGPAASTTYLAWFVPSRHSSNVWAEAIGSDEPFRVNPKGTTAYTGGIDGSTLVYQQSAQDEKPDLLMLDLSTRTQLDVPDGVNTARSEYAPSISGTHLLFGRGIRHGSSVVLFDTSTGTSLVVYSKTNTERRFFEIIPIQVNGNYAVWQQTTVRKNGKFVGGDVWLYDIAAATSTKIPGSEDVWLYGPSVDSDGTMYFGRSNFSCGENAELIERQIDGTESVLYALPVGTDFAFSFAVDNGDGTTDVYFDGGSCSGPDHADILKLPSV